MGLKLNCDLGEGFGVWNNGSDALAMPLIDQASIACGYHAGDPQTMAATIQLAKAHGVEVGAHPSYPDLAGFGRRSMNCTAEQIIAFMHYQLAALDGMCQCAGVEMAYVKPHGALYNDMMAKDYVRKAIMEALQSYYRPMPLVLQASIEREDLLNEAQQLGVDLLFEVFADRRYLANGQLMPRSQKGAVLSKPEILSQVKQFVNQGSVSVSEVDSNEGILSLQADTLCVHGDNSEGIEVLSEIRKVVDASNQQ